MSKTAPWLGWHIYCLAIVNDIHLRQLAVPKWSNPRFWRKNYFSISSLSGMWGACYLLHDGEWRGGTISLDFDERLKNRKSLLATYSCANMSELGSLVQHQLKVRQRCSVD